MKILFVEDDIAFARLFMDTLPDYFSDAGMNDTIEFTHITNLEDALSKIQYNTYELVITDGDFPDTKDGFEKFFNGDKVANAAMAKGMKVIGMSGSPERFKICKTAILKTDANQLPEILKRMQ